MSVVSATCYELLGVPVHAPRSEVARAWQDRRRAALTGPQERSAEEVEALCARLDDAFRTLIDPSRAARYRAYLARQRSAPALTPDDPLRTPLARPWAQGPDLDDVIDAVLQTGSHELPDEDTINTLDEWSTPNAELSTTDPAARVRPALPVAGPRSMPATVTGRHRRIARTRPKTAPGARVLPPWRKDDE